MSNPRVCPQLRLGHSHGFDNHRGPILTVPFIPIAVNISIRYCCKSMQLKTALQQFCLQWRLLHSFLRVLFACTVIVTGNVILCTMAVYWKEQEWFDVDFPTVVFHVRTAHGYYGVIRCKGKFNLNILPAKNTAIIAYFKRGYGPGSSFIKP